MSLSTLLSMKSIFITTVLLACAISSCATPQPTRVSFVDSPQKINHTQTLKEEFTEVPPSLSRSGQSVGQSVSVSDKKPWERGAELRVKSKEDIENAVADPLAEGIRGGGIGVSSSLSIAKSKAMILAKAELASNVKTALREVINSADEDLSGANSEAYRRLIEGVTLAQIEKTRIICFYSKHGAVNEYAVCLQANAEDINVPIEHILKAMTEREIVQLLSAVQKQGEKPNADNQSPRPWSKLGAEIIEKIINKYVVE